MVIINTAEDFIRALDADPDLRKRVQRAIMTDEVLALPAQFEEMLKTQNGMLKEIAELRKTQNGMLETQNEILRDLRAQHGSIRRLQRDFGRFRGNYAHDAMRRNGMDIANQFAQILNMRRLRLDILTEDMRNAILDEAYHELDGSDIPEDAWNTFVGGDLIARVSARGGSGEFYIAVEASFTGMPWDLERATNHARILRCATGSEAYAVVAAVRLSPAIEDSVEEDVIRFVVAHTEEVAFWYPLGEEEMEPDSPA